MIETAVMTHEEAARRDAFARRLFQASGEGGNLVTIYLGDRLCLNQALAELGPVTPGELAIQTGTHERYTREWLEQQAVAGILEVEDTRAEASARRYRLVLATWFIRSKKDGPGLPEFSFPLAQNSMGTPIGDRG